MKTSRLTDKHFKNKNVQRIHRLIKSKSTEDNLLQFCGTIGSFSGFYLVLNMSGSWYHSALTLLSIPMLLAFEDFVNDSQYLNEHPVLFFAGFIGILLCLPILLLIVTYLPLMCFLGASICLNAFFMFLLFFPINYLLQKTADILYSPPSSYRNIILIDFDGNPEMCNSITKYPVLSGYYGYRLPNAGDIEKIEKFMKSA